MPCCASFSTLWTSHVSSQISTYAAPPPATRSTTGSADNLSAIKRRHLPALAGRRAAAAPASRRTEDARLHLGPRRALTRPRLGVREAPVQLFPLCGREQRERA